MEAIPAENVVEDRIYKRVAKPKEKLIGGLIARHLFQLLRKLSLPFFDRETEPRVKLAEYSGSCILVKFNIL